MKKINVIVLSLIILTVLGVCLNSTPAYANGHPGIKIIKSGIWNINTNTITYTFNVTNTGDEVLYNVGISDTKATNITWTSPAGFNGTLYTATGTPNSPNSAVATGTYIVPTNLPDQIQNTATVTSQDFSQKYSNPPQYTTATDTCTFYKVVVIKNTTPQDDTFTFNANPNNPSVQNASGLPASFTITTLNQTGQQVLYVGAGTYGISENAPSGWQLTSSTSSSGTPGNFSVPQATPVTITFNNTKPGDITNPLPEMPAGLLFGVGLAGLGTFFVIKRRKSRAGTGV